ncbi:MAG: hypothetical protein KDC80_12515 [Saprospiraceae bacterium]|nr:hypothetical protein [Saprospiraceae bacterium]
MMKLNELIGKIKEKAGEAESLNEKRSLDEMTLLLSELQHKNLTTEEIAGIAATLGLQRGQIQMSQPVEANLQRFKKTLIRDFSFVPVNYYFTLGIGIGLALGTGVGIALGVPFGLPLGIVFGLGAGSGLGLVAGMLVGKSLDKKAEDEGRVLRNL